MKNLALSLLVFSALVYPVVSLAQWQLDGAPVAASAGTQSLPAIVSDGAGGAIVVFADNRGAAGYNIYAQRLNAAGTAQWATGGVAVCSATGDQSNPTIASDGVGGAIVAWHDPRGLNFDIYAQRINASGVTQWTANGVLICGAASNQLFPVIVSDGAAGAIIAWPDTRGGNNDIYMQRVNASGVPQWTANGVPVVTAANDQSGPVLVTDGAGGAILAWQDSRSGGYDIYAERVNASGSLLWVFPTLVCGAAFDQLVPVITSDGAAGAIVAWQDLRSNVNYDIYTQSVNSSGVAQWITNGVSLSAAPNDQTSPVITSDGAGGAIVAWNDFRNPTLDIYAQRVNASGNPLWAFDGIPMCTAPQTQDSPAIATDGAGGAIVTWEDNRSNVFDIYAQRVSPGGAVQWQSDGVPVCAAANTQSQPRLIADGTGGSIITWQDGRGGSTDIYAQRVENRYGYWGRPEPTLDVVKDNKNDQGGKVVLNWRPSGRDVLNQQTIYLYSIWRALDVAPAEAMLASGNASLVDTPTSKNAKGHTLWLERSPATSYYWELIGSQVANYSEAYSFLASTRQDSTATSSATTYFRVVAESYSQFINWPSNVLSGRSVDNIAPDAPLFLTAQRVASDVHLKWNRVHVPDLKNYSVYRKTSTGVTPIPANFLANDNDTVLVDASAPTSALYYIVTATDVHQNQGKQSNEANVSATTNVGNLPPVTALTVLQNRPNPFSDATQLEIGLPSAGAITVDVYDVAGRRVRELATAGVKGWQEVALTGVDGRGAALASGVYFFKVHAGGETLTRKMLIAR